MSGFVPLPRTRAGPRVRPAARRPGAMKKAVSLAATLILAAGTSLLVWLWRGRAALRYNKLGRHFDEAGGIVYHAARCWFTACWRCSSACCC